MPQRTVRERTVHNAATLAIAVLATAALAGPLTPPAGPPASTDTALRQTDPRTPVNDTNTPGSPTARYRINAPGTYYLTGPIFAGQDQSAIEIAVQGVTLDLNGFTIYGNSLFTTQSVNGIMAPSNTTIRNGVIQDFTEEGISGGNASHVTVEDVRVSGCRNGIFIGNAARIANCHAIANDNTGIISGDSAVVSDCVAAGNGLSGISVQRHAVIQRCAARDNGTFGIFTSNGCLVSQCNASQNGSGILVNQGSLITDSIAHFNSDVGVRLQSFARAHNTVAMVNGGDGFVATSGSHIQHCASIANAAEGFDISSVVIEHSLAYNNDDSGILADGTCTIRHNTSDNNARVGGWGIYIIGDHGLIENNVVRNNQFTGISVIGVGNAIVRNWSLNNGGAAIGFTAGNAIGPTINLFTGTSVLNTPNADHPLANFRD